MAPTLALAHPQADAGAEGDDDHDQEQPAVVQCVVGIHHVKDVGVEPLGQSIQRNHRGVPGQGRVLLCLIHGGYGIRRGCELRVIAKDERPNRVRAGRNARVAGGRAQ